MTQTKKIFTTSDNKYEWFLPNNWSEYDDGDHNTYAFFNVISWSGNLRITPMILDSKSGEIKNKAISMVEEELKENTSAIRMKLGEHVCAFKKNGVLQDNKELVAYRWILGSDNYLFICSFTINKEQESTVRNQDELITVTNILSSVKVL